MFFFQAEDGIRDLVRSRGLGDVYKRQDYIAHEVGHQFGGSHTYNGNTGSCNPTLSSAYEPVSYTHLTLPTSDLV